MKDRGLRKTQTGVVISDKMDKTVVVQVDRLVRHPVYKKYVRRRAKFKAHDENNTCQKGDRVVIRETRPLSKTKRWQVSQILEKAVT
ncbi:MAG: 30S ribosomal protein S17 [Deltaproteobacteria bacterium]|nr:MAG: 30S ribosomal protein S17 [Deltaproteobacteria bacterium]